VANPGTVEVVECLYELTDDLFLLTWGEGGLKVRERWGRAEFHDEVNSFANFVEEEAVGFDDVRVVETFHNLECALRGTE
jgi:hypothetical protein